MMKIKNIQEETIDMMSGSMGTIRQINHSEYLTH